MAKYSIKCSRCGAPIQWNKTALNVSCEYCGQPVNQFKKEDNFKNKFGTFLNKIPFPSKEKIQGKFKVLLSKQNILSESQLEFIGTNTNRFFSKKRNIAILISIPIISWGYMKINYPIKAKPFIPDLPSVPPIPEKTGKFVLYDKSNIYEELVYRSHLCKDKKTESERADCRTLTRKFKNYIDIESGVKFGDWSIFRQAYIGKWNQDDLIPSYTAKDGTELAHIAVNCKKKIIAYYSAGFPDWYSEFSNWEEKDNKQFRREIPSLYVKKMGKLWWVDNYSFNEDFENGEYLSWHKRQIKTYKELLSEVLKDKKYCPYNNKNDYRCTPLFRQEHIDLYSNAVKRQKDNYKGELLERRRNAVAYNKLISAVCKK